MVKNYRQTFSSSRLKTEQFDVVPCIYLSVEGAKTEKRYFQEMYKRLKAELINQGYNEVLLKIEVIDKAKGHSSIELIMESMRTFMRNNNYPYFVLDELLKLSSEDEVKKYLREEGDKVQEGLDDIVWAFNLEKPLLLSYLQGEIQPRDYFAVIFDRDVCSHSEVQIQNCFEECQRLKCGMFLSNPCFEVWLALHFCDISTIFSQEQVKSVNANEIDIKKELRSIISVNANHNKNITSGKFNHNYWSNIPSARINAVKLCCSYPDLLDQMGTNISSLFDKIVGMLPHDMQEIFGRKP